MFPKKHAGIDVLLLRDDGTSDKSVWFRVIIDKETGKIRTHDPKVQNEWEHCSDIINGRLDWIDKIYKVKV